MIERLIFEIILLVTFQGQARDLPLQMVLKQNALPLQWQVQGMPLQIDSLCINIPRPHGGLGFDGNYLWCVSNGDSLSIFYRIDPTNGKVKNFFYAPYQGYTKGLTSDGMNVYAVNHSDNAIYKLTFDGAIVNKLSPPGILPNGITFDGVNLWVTDYSTQNLIKLDTLGAILNSYTKAEGIILLEDLAFCQDRLWAVDIGGIYEIYTYGSYYYIRKELSFPGKYFFPQGLASDGAFLYYCSEADCYIYKLDMREDFETDDGGFIPDPDFASFEWGIPTYGPVSGYSKTHCWATRLDTTYSNLADWKLTSPSVDISWFNFTKPCLYFYHWYDMEDHFDGGNVKLSTDSTNWSIIMPLSGYDDQINNENAGIPNEWGFTDSAKYWHRVIFDLTPYADSTVWIRWHFGSDGEGVGTGWYIDDVGFSNLIHDLTVKLILTPERVVKPAQPIIPEIMIKNIGVYTENNFNVTCKIDGEYSDAFPVDSLLPDSSIIISFKSWEPVSGDHTVSTYISSTDDENKANDTLSLMVKALEIVDMTSTQPATPVVIDGNLNEWDLSKGIDISDIVGGYDAANPCSSAIIYFMNDADFLYIGCDFLADESIEPLDQIGIYIDENGNGEWDGWDEEGVYLLLSDTIIYYGQPSGNPYPIPDADASSSLDGNLKYEVKLPFGDNCWEINSFDLEIFIYAYDGRNHQFFGWYPQNLLGMNWTDPHYYGRLALATVSTLEVGERREYKKVGFSFSPNPVFEEANIILYLPENRDFSLTLYDPSGRVVKRLYEGKSGGRVFRLRWDGIEIPSGVYFFLLAMGDTKIVKKMILLR